MKILLSAYACEPQKGSEPAAGWKWIYELSKREHNIYVITRLNNKSNIETYLDKNNPNHKINFIYYDLPSFFIKLKKRFKCTRIYYFIWQCFIFKKCLNLHKKIKFDVIHHITFGGLRHFSLLGEIDANTIIGPLGGSETSPRWLRRYIGFKGFVYETFRDLCNLLTFIDPFFLRSIKKSKKLIFTTKSGKKYCPTIYHNKVYISPIIGLNENEYPKTRVSIEKQKKVLFAGRHLHWKGMRIGIDAFNKALENDPKLRLTIVGSGNATKYWKSSVKNYRIDSFVKWIPWLSKSEYEKIYRSHGIFIFPSLHDSGGFVVLDALKNGLPVICFDLGGPADTLNKSSGIIIKTDIKDYKLLTENFSNAINQLSSDRETWELLSKGAQKRSKDFLMKKLVDKFY